MANDLIFNLFNLLNFCKLLKFFKSYKPKTPLIMKLLTNNKINKDYIQKGSYQ